MSATTEKYAFGMIGLGVMGRSLLLNIADHGYAAAGHDKDAEKVASLNEEAGDRKVKGFGDVKEFIQSLSTPRAIMMLVPAGKIVDAVIEELPHF
jgi:6-phosphogluconate dehydrogenase